jgi:hypothetical protein
MKLRRAFGVLAVAAFAAQAAAQNPVAIKVYDPKAGDRVRITEVEKATSTTSVMGQVKEEKSTKTLVYVEECVTPPAEAGKKSLKVIRTFEKIESSKDGKAALGTELVGKPIVIEKKGDQYSFTVDGEGVTGPIADVLRQAYDKDDGPAAKDIFPAAPVKPGETWKIDAKKALAGAADDKFSVDVDKATMSGKLVKAYQKDGAGYGVIEVKSSMPITGLGPKSPLTIKPGSSLTMTATGDGCIDGSRDGGEMTTTMTIKLEAATMGVDVSVVAIVTKKKTTVHLPKTK